MFLLQEFKAQTSFSLLSVMHKGLKKILKACWHLHLEGSTVGPLKDAHPLSLCPLGGVRTPNFAEEQFGNEGGMLAIEGVMTRCSACVVVPLP